MSRHCSQRSMTSGVIQGFLFRCCFPGSQITVSVTALLKWVIVESESPSSTTSVTSGKSTMHIQHNRKDTVHMRTHVDMGIKMIYYSVIYQIHNSLTVYFFGNIPLAKITNIHMIYVHIQWSAVTLMQLINSVCEISLR